MINTRWNIFSISLYLILILLSCTKQNAIQYPLLVKEIDPIRAGQDATKIRQEVAVNLAEGLELALWASDSLITDPVAISVDPQGGIYYNNGTRLEHSEFDIRGHRDWMTESISFQSVEDRRAFIRETFAPERSEANKDMLEDLNQDGSHDWKDLTVEKESIWRVEDRSGNGYADRTQLFIEDFHEETTDLANGVEYADGNVFIPVGPDLWRAKDVDGDGIADEKESLAHGFAVHIGFGAHGMSGAIMGPDGRIWWGIGDIGMNVVDQGGKQWKYPNQGVIVRCETDGSGFEVFAAGLRNTHEFVFDEYGNLITEDNDGDHPGERERLVYITNGSDGGWRINWQFGKYTDPDNNSYKVWMDEKLHIPRWDGQAAYITPPILNYVNGPTGLVYNPGTALGEQWKNFFFIAEFRGSPANSPVHAFRMKPAGASFELDTTMEIVSGLLPTGMDFGPDGALYIADWIDGWGIKEEGRIWKLDVPGGATSTVRLETKTLIQADFGERSESDLGALLKYPDMRVRQKAQFELVKRGPNGLEALQAAVDQVDHQLARVHGLWGIAQLARQDLKIASRLVPYLDDHDPEIQAQACKMIGDVRYTGAQDRLINLLKHPSQRVEFFAAEALGRTKGENAVQPIIDMLIANDDQDAWLRHAGVLALSRIGQADPLIALHTHASRAARVAGVVALRRMQHPGVRSFLQDSDEYVVTEAARAINDDFSIEEALPDLANLLNTTPFSGEPLIRRSINANLRVGNQKNLENLSEYILKKNAPPGLTAEALATLSTWANPSVLDRVDGRYRGPVQRDSKAMLSVLEPIVLNLLMSSQGVLLVSAIDASARVNLKSTTPLMLKLIESGKNNEAVIAALTCLQKFKTEELADALTISLKNQDTEIRSKALSIIPDSELSAELAVNLYKEVLVSGTIKEQQAAYAGLKDIQSEAAKQLILDELIKVNQGKSNPAVHLDVLEAAESIDNPEVRALLDKISEGYQADPSAKYTGAIEGGDSRKGRQIFIRHEAAQCVRCHSIFEWGGDAGPNLAGVGSRLSPEKIVESLITPSADLSAGYGIVSLEIEAEEMISGFVLEENESVLKLKIANEQIRVVDKSKISKRQDIPSAMPSVANILTVRELRDLVAFLVELKEEDI